MDDIWNKRREQLEATVRKTTLDLFEHTGSGALKLPLDPPHKTLFVMAGDEPALLSLLGNTRPSITEGVPEGWGLGVVSPEDGGWSAYIYKPVPPQLRPVGITGYGPTPESAIADAATRARREG